ncbi:Alpha/Beta hydrolase protein [Pyronema omphalodes]|nr:Alpha/Beta hydrolase protein [Pyronema omphalodes]
MRLPSLLVLAVTAFAADQQALSHSRNRSPSLSSSSPPVAGPSSTPSPRPTISPTLFSHLTSLSELVDITYCLSPPPFPAGLYAPFECLSFCSLYPSLRLLTTFHTGLALTDTTGYLALDPPNRRILLAFRGTYSLAGAVADLTVAPQAYLPYGGSDCKNCTVHAGFLSSWKEAAKVVVPEIEGVLRKEEYQRWSVQVVGHSLGGAIAALAGLEGSARGWDVRVVTFGEPKVGNGEFAGYLDGVFNISRTDANMGQKTMPTETRDGKTQETGTRGTEIPKYIRVTHAGDPVPMLPPAWGYSHHAGEVFIAKRALPVSREDVRICEGAEDKECSIGEGVGLWTAVDRHRDYFHRMGVCVPLEIGGWYQGDGEL